MTNVNETVVRYIAAWNERDPKRRRELVAATWTEDGSYIDAHRHGKGHGAIDAMLATTQAQFPGYRLNLISGIEAHNNFVRFSWAAGGTNEAPLYLGGTDFATLAPGRPHQRRGRLHRRRSGTDEMTTGGRLPQGAPTGPTAGTGEIRAGVRNTPLSWSRPRNAG